MRTILTTTALALALLVPQVGMVQAQESGSSGGSSGTTGMMTTTPRDASDDAAGTRGTQMGGDPGSAVDPAAGQGDQTGATTAESSSLNDMRSEQVIGQTLYGSEGEEIGQIRDVVMRQGGTSPEFLVGVGGFLGIGERDVTIPMDQVQYEGDRLTTSMTRDSIAELQPHEESGYQSWDPTRPFGG